MLDRWQRLDPAPARLQVDNLPTPALGSMLSAMLRIGPCGAATLADAIGPRTSGNPYDTIELVNALRRDGTLTVTAEGWAWDAAARASAYAAPGSSICPPPASVPSPRQPG